MYYIDKDDLKIVLALLLFEGKELTTTKLVKLIYNVNDEYQLRGLDSNIRKKLEKLTKYGILIKEELNGKTVYKLNKEAIFIGFKIKDGPIIINRIE